MFHLDSSGAIYFEVDADKVQEALAGLGKDAPKALKTAVNMTARQVQTKLTGKAGETYAVKSSKFKGSMRRKNAANSNPVAIISATGARLPLSDFKYRKQGGGSAAKAKVLAANGLKDMYYKPEDVKGFIATFDSGHVAVVRRYPGTMYTNPAKKAARKEKHMDLTAIREYTAASVPYMLGNKFRVYGILEPEFEEMLMANLEEVWWKYKGGRPGG